MVGGVAIKDTCRFQDLAADVCSEIRRQVGFGRKVEARSGVQFDALTIGRCAFGIRNEKPFDERIHLVRTLVPGRFQRDHFQKVGVFLRVAVVVGLVPVGPEAAGGAGFAPGRQKTGIGEVRGRTIGPERGAEDGLAFAQPCAIGCHGCPDEGGGGEGGVGGGEGGVGGGVGGVGASLAALAAASAASLAAKAASAAAALAEAKAAAKAEA